MISHSHMILFITLILSCLSLNRSISLVAVAAEFKEGALPTALKAKEHSRPLLKNVKYQSEACVGCQTQIPSSDLSKHEFVVLVSKALSKGILEAVNNNDEAKSVKYEFGKILSSPTLHFSIVSGTSQVVAGSRYRLEMDLCATPNGKVDCGAFYLDFVERPWEDTEEKKIDIMELSISKIRSYQKSTSLGDQLPQPSADTVNSMYEIDNNQASKVVNQNSAGETAGIVVGAILGSVLLLGLGVAFFTLRKKHVLSN